MPGREMTHLPGPRLTFLTQTVPGRAPEHTGCRPRGWVLSCSAHADPKSPLVGPHLTSECGTIAARALNNLKRFNEL